MFFINNRYFLTTCVRAIALFSIALLIACSGDNDKRSSSSSSVSNSYLSSSSISSFSSSSTSTLTTPHLGLWYAPAYGYVLSVNVESEAFTVKTYNVTTDYCLLQNVALNLTLDKLKQEFVYSNVEQETLLENNGVYPPGIKYEKLAQFPIACEKNLQRVKSDPGYTFDAKKDLEIFWQTLNELYINFDLREVNWDEVYAQSLESIDEIKDEDELFEFLGTLISPLGDGHAALLQAPLKQDFYGSINNAVRNDHIRFFGVSNKVSTYQKLVNEYIQALQAKGDFSGELTDSQREAADEYYFANYNQIMDIIFGYADENVDVEVRAAGEVAWFKTGDNIGYLIIGSMAGFNGDSPLIANVASDIAIAEAAINDALRDLADTEGMIIDIRVNEGGSDQVALNFVRHFIDKPQHVYSKYAGKGNSTTPVQDVVLDPQSHNIYLKPTAVLVSGDTASAAELFTIAMASLPHVIVIGEPTAGEFSDILVKRLTSDIAFGISNETYLDVEGNNYERVGIPADIAVPFGTIQERKDGYDGGMNAAIDWIKNAP